MKIVIVYPEEFRGHFAREYHIYRLANNLAAAGCEVTLAAGDSRNFHTAADLGRQFREAPHPALNVIWFRRKFWFGLKWSGWFFRQLGRWLKKQHGIDVIYTMHVKAAYDLACDYPHHRFVFEAHEIFADTYPTGSEKFDKLTALEKEIHANAAGVVAISPYLAQCLRERYQPRGPIHVQHDGIDPEPGAWNPTADNHQLIYVGSLQGWKGVPIAIEAMRQLPEFHLTVVGGQGEKLEELMKSAPKNVSFTGHVKREALPALLAQAGIGLMPNLLEPRSALYTFPLKLLEYSAAGKGIVASHIPVFDSVDAADWVKLVESGSPAALAAGIRELAQASPDREKARAWAEQFTWDKQGRRLKEFLEQVIKGRAE